ncbi:hypothetical protein IG631_16670 [Alternaria alternata]|nr:hypothetical protein IG631_16670 [Alternaria alternata]
MAACTSTKQPVPPAGRSRAPAYLQSWASAASSVRAVSCRHFHVPLPMAGTTSEPSTDPCALRENGIAAIDLSESCRELQTSPYCLSAIYKPSFLCLAN